MSCIIKMDVHNLALLVTPAISYSHH